MTAPAQPVVRGDLLAAVRQLVVATGKLGTAVYRAEAIDNPRTPYATLDDTEPTDALSGDGGPLGQTRVIVLSVYQANSRDANPRLGHELADLLHGQAVIVGTENTPATWRRVVLRCKGRVNVAPVEGYNVQEVSISCYGPAVP